MLAGQSVDTAHVVPVQPICNVRGVQVASHGIQTSHGAIQHAAQSAVLLRGAGTGTRVVRTGGDGTIGASRLEPTTTTTAASEQSRERTGDSKSQPCLGI